MWKTIFATVLLWTVFIFVLAWADQDTGTYTSHEYLYKPGYGDYGTTHYNKRMASFDRADRGIHTGNILKMCVEYPVSGDNLGAQRIPSQLEIDDVTVVLRRDAGENVTFNIKHGTDRSGAGASNLFTSDITAVSNTAGQTITSFDDATINTNEWVWISVYQPIMRF